MSDLVDPADLSDGLHFTPEGYAVLLEKLVEVIKQNYPELDAEQIQEPMPRQVVPSL